MERRLGLKLVAGIILTALAASGMISTGSMLNAFLLLIAGLFAIQQLIAPALTGAVRAAIMGSLAVCAAWNALHGDYMAAAMLGLVSVSFYASDVRAAAARSMPVARMAISAF